MGSNAGFSQQLLASSAQTTTFYTPQAAGISGVIGALFFVKITVVTGTSTPTLTITLQALDEGSGDWVDLASGSGITGTGSTKYIVYPNVSGSLYSVLPPNYRLKCAITGTTPSFTMSVGVSYLP